MRQAEVKDWRSFLTEPVEEITLKREDEWQNEYVAQTRPERRIVQPGVEQRPASGMLRPQRLQKYQSRGFTVSLTRSVSGTLRLRPVSDRASQPLRTRETGQLAPAPQKIVPIEPSATLTSEWRIPGDIAMWFILTLLFLLVVLGGIGFDSLIANYH